jgi:hypothetical protein
VGENLALALFFGFACISAGLLFLFLRRVGRNVGESQKSTAGGLRTILLGNTLVLLFLFSLLVLGGEIYYRFFTDTTDSLLFTKVSQRWHLRYWHENKDGLRDNVDYSLALTPGKPRITFLGDSFTAAHGVKNIEDRFVNRIRQAHPEWEVHMLAKPGWDTDDEMDYLGASITNGYQLNEVVLVYCLNDVSDLMPERFENIKRIVDDLTHSGWLRSNSFLVNTLYHRIQVRRDPFMRNYYGFVKGAYRGALWETQKQRLKKLRDLVQEHGGHLAVVTFPFLQALGPGYEYQFAHYELDEFWRGLKVPQLDLLTVYQDLPPGKLVVNRFDAHPNEYAHALAAAAIDKFLRTQLAANPL